MVFNQKILKNDYFYLTIMIIFALICTLKMAEFCLSGGTLNPDISLYSISALKYAGMDYYNITNLDELYHTPIISFLTSLLFRVGLVDKSAIIIVSTVFCFSSYVGFYFLLKRRFNSLLSFIGVIIFGSTSVIIFNLSKGMIDIPALSISIWTIFFAVKAIDDDPKFFLISFPLWVIGFFVKYSTGFTLPVIVVYYLMNKNIVDVFDSILSDRSLFKEKVKGYVFSKEFKYILISCFISLILAIIICKTLILDFGGHLSFFEQSTKTFQGNDKFSQSAIYSLDKSYYLDSFSDFLYEKQNFGVYFANLLYVIFAGGLLINLLNIIINSEFIESKKKSFQTKHLDKILMILDVVLIFVSYYGFKVLENNMVSNISLICVVIISHALLNKYPCNEKKLSFNLLFITYFFVNLVFISLYPHKTLRYALPLLPPFVYAIIWALDSIFYYLSNGFDNNETFVKEINFNIDYSNPAKIISIVLIAIFLLSTFSFILPMEFNRSNNVYQEVLYCGYSNDLDDACDYIINSDPDYHSKTFASFLHSSRIIRWNLNVNVTAIGLHDHNLRHFNETDYLILFEKKRLDNYHKIKHVGDFYIYYRN